MVASLYFGVEKATCFKWEPCSSRVPSAITFAAGHWRRAPTGPLAPHEDSPSAPLRCSPCSSLHSAPASIRASEWLWLEKVVPKWHPGTWRQRPKPASPLALLTSSHTQTTQPRGQVSSQPVEGIGPTFREHLWWSSVNCEVVLLIKNSAPQRGRAASSRQDLPVKNRALAIVLSWVKNQREGYFKSRWQTREFDMPLDFRSLIGLIRNFGIENNLRDEPKSDQTASRSIPTSCCLNNPTKRVRQSNAANAVPFRVSNFKSKPPPVSPFPEPPNHPPNAAKLHVVLGTEAHRLTEACPAPPIHVGEPYHGLQGTSTVNIAKNRSVNSACERTETSS